MELHKFIEKFLPDYDKKFDEAYKNRHNVKNADLDFKDKYFPEALQVFADRICEKQIEKCADFVFERLDDHEAEPFENGIYVDYYDMWHSEYAKIEDL